MLFENINWFSQHLMWQIKNQKVCIYHVPFFNVNKVSSGSLRRLRENLLSNDNQFCLKKHAKLDY